MVKTATSGSDRGMRLVREESALLKNIRLARSEAANAFGSGQLLIEKAVVDARHVEMQVFGDRHGNVVHLGARDCSIQRRNQKVVEESPSPAVDDALRLKIGAVAVHHVGAGTVDFLLALDGAFYFLEMNTRLLRAVEETQLLGVTSNRDYLHAVLATEVFADGGFDTSFVGKHFLQQRIARHAPRHDTCWWQPSRCILMTRSGWRQNVRSLQNCWAGTARSRR